MYKLKKYCSSKTLFSSMTEKPNELKSDTPQIGTQ